MSLRSFVVTREKSLVRAECELVPPLMIVAGPNGVGKSSLLYALKRRVGSTFERETQILYQPPHRAIRRQQVRRRWLQTAFRGFSDLLAGDDVGGFEGLNIQFPQRIPDNVDESGSTLKYTFGRLESRRQGSLSALVDDVRERSGIIDTSAIADVYSPIKRLVGILVPHLEFRGISFLNEDDIRLTFRVLGSEPPTDVDLDDLSSGEKAILLLFMPLIERQMDQLLGSLAGIGEAETPAVDRLFLIDEPEEHLHPELQGRVITYLREEGVHGRFQAVLATHSPTLLDLATDAELFVLNRPVGDRNQLARVSTAAERLEALKELVGNPYIVTTGRTIVLVEGPPGGGRNTDVRVLDRIHPAATRYTFIPMGGRASVISAVRALRQEISERRFGVTILGVVDRDRRPPDEEGVITWDFASIENLLLLDSSAIASAVAAVGGPSMTPGQVDRRLKDAARAIRDDEVRVRVSHALKTRMLRFGGTVAAEIAEQMCQASMALADEAGDLESIERAIERATTTAEGELERGDYRRRFRGKELLHALLGQLALHNTPYAEFLYALADSAATAPQAQAALSTVFTALDDARTARIEAVVLDRGGDPVA